MHVLLNFSMSNVILVMQSLNHCEKFCLWALIIVINMSVAICQLPTCQFSAFRKGQYVFQSNIA